MTLGLAPALHAADALDRAIAHADALQTRALAAVTTAERALAEAQADLRVLHGIEADARQAKDPAALRVAGEAVREAQALERETRRNLDLARELLNARGRQLHELRGWARADRRPRALLVAESGEVRHIAPGGYEPPDLPPLRAGETIKTGPDGRARLFISGGDGEVALGANTSYTVTQDDAQAGFVGQLESGLMRLRALVRNKVGKKFEVRTPSAVTSVRGTDYSVARTPAGDVIRVHEGVVAVTSPTGGEAVLLKAGEQLHVPLQGAWPDPQPFTTDDVELPWSADRASR